MNNYYWNYYTPPNQSTPYPTTNNQQCQSGDGYGYLYRNSCLQPMIGWPGNSFYRPYWYGGAVYPVYSVSGMGSGSAPPSVQPSVGQIGSVQPVSLQPGGDGGDGGCGGGAAGTVENGQSGCVSGAVKREEDTTDLSSIQHASTAAAVPVEKGQYACSDGVAADNGRDSAVLKREEEVPALSMQPPSSAISVKPTTSSGTASDCAPVAVKSEEEKTRPAVRLPPVDHQMVGLSLSSLLSSGSSLCVERNGEKADPTQEVIRLASLNVQEITPSQAIFYFGVLAIQSLLLPRFHYDHDERERKWACTLTMYGYTIAKPHIFDSREEAKIEICRESLKMLVPQFPKWTVPREPEECLNTLAWNWVEILQDYCVQNGLRKPEYMQYTRGYNFRHEVELEEGSFFGFQKQYPDDWSSRNAAAHMGLHALLVYGKDVPHSCPGPFTLRRSNESMLAHVPRIPASEDGDTSSLILGCTNRGIKREATDDQVSSDGNHKKPRTRTRGRRGGQTKCKNANLLPLAESKIPGVEAKPQEEKRKWNVTPGQLQDQIKGLATSCEKLERDRQASKETCEILSLQRPEIHIERPDGRLIESAGEYTAAAYFQGDPFLTRAGPIGAIKGFRLSKTLARESCASEVVRYLIKMVNEDTILEEEEAAKREAPEVWREKIVRIYTQQGWLEAE